MRRRTRLPSLLIALLALNLFVMPAAPAFAEPAAPDAVLDDEIAVIEYPSGRIRIDDPSQPPGIAPFTWNSGSDTGWGWVAAGDFNGDGDKELAALRGGELRVFDPFVQPGYSPVAFQTNLTGGRAYTLLATGDLDRDGRDEIVATHTETGAVAQTLQVWDGGGTGTVWSLTRSESFSGSWQGIAMGDMNNDGYYDVALFRNVDNRIKVYSGFNWTPALAEATYSADWLTLALGNISSSYPGAEMALTRSEVGATLNSLILFRLATTGLIDLISPVPDYRFFPHFRSIALGDANGDGDDEVMMLRNPESNNISIKLVNPAGAGMRDFQQAIGFGGTAWNQVRMGDIDGDGRDEPIVLRQDRYRIYWQVELDDSFTDYPGTYRTPSLAVDYDRPAMAPGNFDGPGVPGNSPFVVAPLQATIGHLAGAPPSHAGVSITRAGIATGWTASVTSGFDGLSIVNPSGTTPSTLMLRVTTPTPGTYFGTVRIQANDLGIPGAIQDVQVAAIVVDKGAYLPMISK
jgi:hypothetical protein